MYSSTTTPQRHNAGGGESRNPTVYRQRQTNTTSKHNHYLLSSVHTHPYIHTQSLLSNEKSTMTKINIEYYCVMRTLGKNTLASDQCSDLNRI